MTPDTRLARLLHVLLHLHLRGGTTTSDTLALMLHTNPVVVRRMMASLRRAGYVASTGGRGGGWALTKELGGLTVGDVHRAIGRVALFAIGPAEDNPRCPVESAVNGFLVAALQAAEEKLLEGLANKTLAQLARQLLPSGQPRRGGRKTSPPRRSARP